MKHTLAEEEVFWGEKYGKIYPELENATPYKTLLREIKKLLSDEISGRWLDVGCGSGGITDLLWRASEGRIEKVVAFDLTSTMLDHTRKKIERFSPRPREGQIQLLKHDLSYKLPFPDDHFDGIIANLVLPYVIAHEGKAGKQALIAVLGEMHRVLKPGGVFIWSTPIKNVKFWKVFMASWREILDPRRIKNMYYGPAILKHALRIQKKGESEVYTFLTKSEIAQVLHDWGFVDMEFRTSFAGQALIVKAAK